MKQFVRPGKVFDWQKGMTYFTSYDVRFLAQDIATIANPIAADRGVMISQNVRGKTGGAYKGGRIEVSQGKKKASKYSEKILSITTPNAKPLRVNGVECK